MPNKECCQGSDNPVGTLCRDCPHGDLKPRPSLDILDPSDIAARLKETGRFDKDEPWPGWNGGKKLIEKEAEPASAPKDEHEALLDAYGILMGGPVTGRWSGGLPMQNTFPRPYDHSPNIIYVKTSQVGLVDSLMQDMLAKKSRAAHLQFPKPVRVNVRGPDPDPKRLLDTWGHSKLEHIATFTLFATFGFDPSHMPKFDAVRCDNEYTRVTAHWTDMVPIIHDEVRAMHNTLFIPATGHAIWQREPE